MSGVFCFVLFWWAAANIFWNDTKLTYILKIAVFKKWSAVIILDQENWWNLGTSGGTVLEISSICIIVLQGLAVNVGSPSTTSPSAPVPMCSPKVDLTSRLSPSGLPQSTRLEPRIPGHRLVCGLSLKSVWGLHCQLSSCDLSMHGIMGSQWLHKLECYLPGSVASVHGRGL